MGVSAEKSVLGALDESRYEVEIVHLGATATKGRLPEAEKPGIKSIPALALDDQVLPINFGASLSDLK